MNAAAKDVIYMNTFASEGLNVKRETIQDRQLMRKSVSAVPDESCQTRMDIHKPLDGYSTGSRRFDDFDRNSGRLHLRSQFRERTGPGRTKSSLSRSSSRLSVLRHKRKSFYFASRVRVSYCQNFLNFCVLGT
jgi:hypothetical protein